MLEIHQQEGEIVKHVDAGERSAEIDAVEEKRPTVEETDIAEMKIAVTMPHLPGEPSPLEQRAQRGQRRARGGAQRFDLGRREDRRGEAGECLLVYGQHRGDTGAAALVRCA